MEEELVVSIPEIPILYKDESIVVVSKPAGLLVHKTKIAEEQKQKNKDKDGFVPRDVVSKSYRGEKFFDFVLEAYDANRISPAVVRDVLDLKLVGLGRLDK